MIYFVILGKSDFIKYFLNRLFSDNYFLKIFRVFKRIYLKFKAAKTAIVSVMTTPRLTCQFRNIITSYYHFIANYLYISD